MTENISNLVKKKNHINSVRAESPNQDEPKQAHSKTHQIKMAKFKSKENLKESKGESANNK